MIGFLTPFPSWKTYNRAAVLLNVYISQCWISGSSTYIRPSFSFLLLFFFFFFFAEQAMKFVPLFVDHLRMETRSCQCLLLCFFFLCFILFYCCCFLLLFFASSNPLYGVANGVSPIILTSYLRVSFICTLFDTLDTRHHGHKQTKSLYVIFQLLFRCCSVAWRRGLSQKFACFVKSYQINVLFNLSCVWILHKNFCCCCC